MQLLFESSEESPGKGLGLLKGNVVRLPSSVKAPHMGWNTLRVVRMNELLDGIGEDDYFYFVHSYYGNPVDRDVIVAETGYGLNFASVVVCRNIWATQFHPEKSGKPGEIILRNFAGILKK
jgi:glutamine amidotransferase